MAEVMTQTTTRPPLNGVDTPTLFATHRRGERPTRRWPSSSSARRNRWLSGTHSRDTIETFYGAGGEHAHKRDVHARRRPPGRARRRATTRRFRSSTCCTRLASCITSGIGNIAAARGVTLTEVESTVEGDIDLRGILGLSADVRNGYEGIRASFTIKGDAPAEKLRQIVEQSRARSAVFDVLTNGVPVDVDSQRRLNAMRHVDLRRDRRRRPGRAGDEPVPDRPRRQPCRARARPHGGAVAERALGLAAPAHAELAEPPARVPLRRDRSRRLHDDAGGGRATSSGTRASFRAPVRAGVEVHASRARDGASASTPTADVAGANRRDRDRATRHARACRASPRADPADSSTPCPTRYRRPSQLPTAACWWSARRPQVSSWPTRSIAPDRPVTIAVGHHTRLPRVYRGADILWWLDRMGLFDETIDQVYDPVEVSRQSALAATGGASRPRDARPRRASRRGVRVVGRLLDVLDGTARFADDLVATTAAADIKLAACCIASTRSSLAQGIDAPPAPPFVPQCLRFAGRRRRCPWRATASARWSGPRGSLAPIHGCTCPWSARLGDSTRGRRDARARACTSLGLPFPAAAEVRLHRWRRRRRAGPGGARRRLRGRRASGGGLTGNAP